MRAYCKISGEIRVRIRKEGGETIVLVVPIVGFRGATGEAPRYNSCQPLLGSLCQPHILCKVGIFIEQPRNLLPVVTFRHQPQVPADGYVEVDRY